MTVSLSRQVGSQLARCNIQQRDTIATLQVVVWLLLPLMLLLLQLLLLQLLKQLISVEPAVTFSCSLMANVLFHYPGVFGKLYLTRRILFNDNYSSSRVLPIIQVATYSISCTIPSIFSCLLQACSSYSSNSGLVAYLSMILGIYICNPYKYRCIYIRNLLYKLISFPTYACFLLFSNRLNKMIDHNLVVSG